MGNFAVINTATNWVASTFRMFRGKKTLAMGWRNRRSVFTGTNVNDAAVVLLNHKSSG